MGSQIQGKAIRLSASFYAAQRANNEGGETEQNLRNNRTSPQVFAVTAG